MKAPDFPIGPEVSATIADMISENPTVSDTELLEALGLPEGHPAVTTDLLLGRLLATENPDENLVLKLLAKQRANILAATTARVATLLEGMSHEDLKTHLDVGERLTEGGANYVPTQLLSVADLWGFVEELAGNLSVGIEEIIWMSADYLSRGLTREQVKSRVASNISSETRQEIEGDTSDDQTSGSDHNPTP